MVDIRAKYILGEIRKVSEHAILAGGAVRDTYFGLEPKDYDFFVPTKFFGAVTTKLSETYGKGSFSDKKYAYARNSYLKGVYDTKIEGCDVQVMSSDFQGNDDFATNVISTFDFGINRIYYDGGGILRDSEEFQKDDAQNTMTLYTLNDIKYLPKYLDRFQRINAKFKNRFTFKSPCIMIVDPVTREEVKDDGKYKFEKPVKFDRAYMEALNVVLDGGPRVNMDRMGVAIAEIENRRPPILPAPEGWLREVAVEAEWDVIPAPAEPRPAPQRIVLNGAEFANPFFNGNN